MLGNGINQVHLVPAGGQPAAVNSRASAGIHDRGWSGRKVPQNQFLGARMFEPKPSCAQARGFIGGSVETNNFADRIFVAHANAFKYSLTLVRGRSL